MTPESSTPESMTKPHSDLGLYIHWPFCLSKCPYCDFNSHVSNQIDEAQWQQAMLTELSYMAELCDHSYEGRRPLRSVFFGGGTPSLMPASLVGALIDKAEALFGFTDDCEITAEANPTSVETEKLTSFQSAGINRLSLGVQALDDAALRFLGRGHDSQQAIAALMKARTLFDRISIDLIYGRAGQSAKQWQTELDHALSFDLDHLSLYQLTIEQGTQFYTRARSGEILSVDDDAMAELYQITEARTAAHGLHCYEISNYAKQGARSRHNQIYWRTNDWLGIGPGAFGRLTIRDAQGLARSETSLRASPAGWLAQTRRLGHGIKQTRIDRDEALLEEILMMGLRLSEGVPLSRLQHLTSHQNWPFAPADLAPFIEQGWLSLTDDYLSASFEGRLRLNYILGRLLG